MVQCLNMKRLGISRAALFLKSAASPDSEKNADRTVVFGNNDAPLMKDDFMSYS